MRAGTLTFLFTDVEGSTAEWEAHPVEMSAALKQHDEIMQSTIKKHDGRVFKKAGDAFCAAFDRASSAALAALDVQQAITKTASSAPRALAVRMAIHTGEAEHRDNDYFGPALNRVSRLLDVAYGEQILLSSATAAVLRSDPAFPFEVRRLGAYRLRDLEGPEEIYQVVKPGLRDQFPQLRALDSSPNNLPLRLTSFVGRDKEVDALKHLIDSRRLVTLVGPGGVGKTRLAIELAAGLLTDYADGAWIVDLAAVREEQLVEAAVASALNVRAFAGDGGIALEKHLASKHLLIILDNCEHVIAAAAIVLTHILQRCRNVHAIATSREPLRIDGECVHRVVSLPVPSADENPTVQEVRHCAGIRLFCERAGEANESFVLDEDNVATVTEICRRVDGIPLAIELTASQLRVLSLEHVKEHLKERLSFPVGTNRTALPRHMTIESLIDWSYSLLQPREKVAFPRISIFSGTFSLDAAGFVCADDLADRNTALISLSSLVEQSLLFAELAGETERYRFLQTTRQYALAKLRAMDDFDETSTRHVQFFRQLVRKADLDFHTTPHDLWLRRLRLELDNIRGVLGWTLLEGRDPVAGAEVVGWLDRFWYEAGLTHEAEHWTERAINLLDENAHGALLARLWLARSYGLSGNDRVQALERSRAFYELVDDARGLARSLRALGGALRLVGRTPEARGALQRATALLVGAENAGPRALTLCSLGASYAYSREFGEARSLYSKALDEARSSNAQYALMMAYMHMADLEFSCDDCSSAITNAMEALNLAQAADNSQFYATIKANIAAYRIASNQPELARRDARDALQIFRTNRDSYQVASVVLHLAYLAAADGATDAAARLVGYSDAHMKVHGIEREPTERWVRHETIGLLERKSSPEAVERGLAMGGTISEQEAVRLALAS